MALPEEGFVGDTTQELQRLLGRAIMVSEASSERFDLSFTTILVAFLISDDPVSQWFQRYVLRSGVSRDALLARIGIDLVQLEAIAGSEPQDVWMDRSPTVTDSTRGILSEATELRQSFAEPGDPSPLLDVRHVMGAYIYRPAGHEGQLVSWGFNREAWSSAFLGLVQSQFPNELDNWIKVHLSAFGTTPTIEPVADVELEGLSAHVARDIWTIDDALGYDFYAYAIYRFITHPETEAPLTISIQAPWGGGKTSLMRMIRRRLDPTAPLTPFEGQGEPSKKGPTVGLVRQELMGSGRRQQLQFHLPDEERAGMERLTVWFNAWKYESTEQVWAGLADTIVRQVASRLGRVEREKFWLRLHLRRLDADKIRRTIYERIVNLWWRKAFPWLLGSAAALVGSVGLAIAGRTAQSPFLQYTGLGGMGFSIAFGLVQSILRYRQVIEEPAETNLSEYIRAPDYSGELGFVHHVEEDLQRVFEVIPEEISPIVVFVDDLDRCSPDKVADVVEAVNLFLAAELPECIFVLAMDPDMVAAALEEAHAKVIAKLPADVASTPIGWRFMDKFVQLPFVIPPADGPDLENYARSLLSERGEQEQRDDRISAAVDEAPPAVEDPVEIGETSARLAEKHELTEDERREVERILVRRATYSAMDRGINGFSDQESEILEMVLRTAPQFSHNPRELKRFFNLFRFLSFLKWAREARGRPAPSSEQLRRWILLSMKWPEVVRWLRRSYSGREKAAGEPSRTPVTRLRQLEEIGANSSNLQDWQKEIERRFRLQAAKTAWVADEELMRFFQQDRDLLSDAEGKGGLW